MTAPTLWIVEAHRETTPDHWERIERVVTGSLRAIVRWTLDTLGPDIAFHAKGNTTITIGRFTPADIGRDPGGYGARSQVTSVMWGPVVLRPNGHVDELATRDALAASV